MIRGRVLLDGQILDEKPTGMGVYAQEVVPRISSRLRDHGMKVCVAADSRFSYLFPETDLLSLDGFTSHHGAVNARQRTGVMRTYQSYIRQNGIELFYSPTQHGIVSISDVVRQVITIHDLTPLAAPLQRILPYLYYKCVMPRVLKTADVICPSQATARDLRGRLGVVAKVIPNAISEDNSNETGSESNSWGRYFLSIGMTHAKYKNLHTLVDVVLRNPDLPKLMIIGPPTRYLRQCLRKCSSVDQNRVTYLGYVDSKTKGNLIKGSLGVVYLSLKEGFGLPILESAAHGVPVLTSDVSSMREVGFDYPIRVNPLDKTAIYHGLIQLANERVDEAQLKKTLEYYTWDRAVRQIVEFLVSD